MSDSAGVLTAPEVSWRPKYNPWLIGVVVAMAAFMEVLDTSIANVALPYMAGGLGSSNDESTWVLTSYLVSNAIVLPISGWLASLFGRKRFFIVCNFIFTVASVLCGSAASLSMLLLFRVIQGAGGGGLQPMAQAILADTFPPQKRGLAFACCTESPRSWRPLLVPLSVDGSPITIHGAGSSSLTCRLEILRNVPGHASGRRSAVPGANEEGRRDRRLYWHLTACFGRGSAPSGARQGTGR